MRNPETPREALTLALFLAITAPTEEKSEQAILLAEELMQDMSVDDIRSAKITAQKLAVRVLQ